MMEANGTAKLSLTPQQLCVMMVFEAQEQQLQIATTQLGGYLGLNEPADKLLAAQKLLREYRLEYLRQAQSGIVLATPADMPKART
jgi:hypothetical protein